MRKMKWKRCMMLGLLGLTLLCTGCQKTDPAGGGVVPEVQTDPSSDHEKTPGYQAVLRTKDMASGTETVEGRKLDDAFVEGTTHLSVKLLQKVADQAKQNQNYMISPTSIQMALAMAANGAQGETLQQLERLLGGECYETGDVVKCGTVNMDIATLNEYLTTFIKSLGADENVTFENANSIWIAKDRVQLKDEYLHNIASFQADCFEAPFDKSTVKDINQWVKHHTNNMIPSMLDKIPGDTVMYLINAIAFEGKWEDPFTDEQIVKKFVFRNASGKEQEITAMRSEEHVYLQDEHATGFIKNYKGSRFGFMALLPEEGMTPEAYLATLDGEKFVAMYAARSYEDVNIVMPKFTSDYNIELSDVLKQLGVTNAFAPDADFSAMADTASKSLYINRVLHKTHIEVDEEGTKAAAVTAVEMNETTAAMPEEPKYVTLDRPFVYGIVDLRTGLPVFFGVTNSVDQ